MSASPIEQLLGAMDAHEVDGMMALMAAEPRLLIADGRRATGRNALPRVFVARMQGDRIADLRVYGAHERPLSEHRSGEEGMWIGARWIPPL